MIAVFLWAVGICFSIFWYLRQRNRFFEKLGIPGPKPRLLVGNFLDVAKRRDDLLFTKWSEQYGKVFGYYEGGTPVVMISDPDLIEDVLVKQFSNFPGHRLFPWTNLKDTDDIHAEFVSMFEAVGPKWKRMRMIANPAFGGGHLKTVELAIVNKVNTFIEKIGDKANKATVPFDMNIMCEAFTLDVISEIAFGITTDCQSNYKHPFMTRAKDVMLRTGRGRDLAILEVLWPEMKAVWVKMLIFLAKYARDEPGFALRRILHPAIESYRQKMKNGTADAKASNFFEMMLNAETAPDQIQALKDIAVEKKLTSSELTEQMLLFLLAGSTTTSTTLAMTFYELAKNPQVQQKLCEEVTAAAKDGALTYAKVKELQYLDWVVKETLRLHSIAGNANDRICRKTCTIGDYTIPVGTELKINQWAVHHDKSLWGADADEFRPERFSDPPKHPMAWIPFGGGPRICIGMRFGLMEAKLAVAQAIGKYRLLACAKTLEPLKLATMITLEIPGGIWITAEKR